MLYKVVNKRREARIEYQTSVAVPRRTSRRRSPAEEDVPGVNLDNAPLDMSKGDADGALSVHCLRACRH